MKINITKLVATIFFSVFIFYNSTGQSILINYDLDTNVYNISEPLNLWLNFLKTKDDSLGSQYWNQKEVEAYGHDAYFLIENELQFGLDNYLKLLSYADLKILNIKEKNDLYKITTQMEFKPKDGKSNIQYIFHVYAGDENGDLKLFNAININRKFNLHHETVGYINFYYPKSHLFNRSLAQKQNDFLVELSSNFDVPIDTIDYYFADTEEDIQKIKGLDFFIGGHGKDIPSGKADVKNRIVFASGLNEYYPHEFIHILLNDHFPNCHLWINEGVATYFGMSRGQTLDWHLKKVYQHLSLHHEINLNQMLTLVSLDEYTDFRYALGGFIIGEAFEKGGYNMIKKMMNAGKTDEDFYQSIEQFLNIKPNKIDQYIRKKLKKKFG